MFGKRCRRAESRPEIKWAHFWRCFIRDGDKAIRCIPLIALNFQMRQVIGTYNAFAPVECFCKARTCFESHNSFSCSTRYSVFTIHTNNLTIYRIHTHVANRQPPQSTHYVHLFHQGRALIYLFDLIWFTFAVVLHLPSLYENWIIFFYVEFTQRPSGLSVTAYGDCLSNRNKSRKTKPKKIKMLTESMYLFAQSIFMRFHCGVS